MEKRDDALWIKCSGEAHSNAFIDNCGICMPWWEEYPVCPDDKTTRLTESGKCKTCGKYFNMPCNKFRMVKICENKNKAVYEIDSALYKKTIIITEDDVFIYNRKDKKKRSEVREEMKEEYCHYCEKQIDLEENPEHFNTEEDRFECIEEQKESSEITQTEAQLGRQPQ